MPIKADILQFHSYLIVGVILVVNYQKYSCIEITMHQKAWDERFIDVVLYHLQIDQLVLYLLQIDQMTD